MHKPEQTYRSRPFVFFSFAGIGAFVSNAEAVVIGETGQGALGPAMIRYADEWPFRSTHPGFLSRLSRYLSLAFGKEIAFRAPQLWHTKGEVLRKLVDEGLSRGWDETKSCSVRPNDRHGAPVCGICGGCVLRSLAISSAQIRRCARYPRARSSVARSAGWTVGN
jgi:7-cyano-7-deazaguanine synthase in queuosine biosynthesis